MRSATQLQWRDIERTAAERLQAHGMSLTVGRTAVLKWLSRQGKPVTVSAATKALAGLHRVTLYRSMEALERAGVVKRIRFLHEDEDRFELGDAVRPHHHHLVCESCGTVAAVDSEPRRPRVPRGFKLLRHQLEFYGLCGRCAKGTA